MDRWCGKVAIVSGASTGIGESIVEKLVKAGMQVVGLARRVDRIEAVAAKLNSCKGKLHAVKCDMTVEEDIQKAFEWTTANLGPVHVLVNNAGVMEPTNLIDGDTKMWRTIIDTNLMGLCIASREAVKIMMANNIAGHIVHINSIVGHRHCYSPTISVYGATKHAVTNLTDILRQELNANNAQQIKVSSVSPGCVKTDFFNDASLELKEMLKDIPMLNREDVADAVLYVLGTPQSVHINELTITATGTQF